MKFAETINGYNAMGREDAEYEACYAIAEHHTVGGLHCHDFYEFYIHYQGGKVYYVDGSVFPLQNNQLIVLQRKHAAVHIVDLATLIVDIKFVEIVAMQPADGVVFRYGIARFVLRVFASHRVVAVDGLRKFHRFSSFWVRIF